MIRTVSVALWAFALCAGVAQAKPDFNAAWNACDAAAADHGFAEASIPSGITGSVIDQVAGRWKGQSLITVTSQTATGTVFCMTTGEYYPVLYKFDGKVIFRRAADGG